MGTRGIWSPLSTGKSGQGYIRYTCYVYKHISTYNQQHHECPQKIVYTNFN